MKRSVKGWALVSSDRSLRATAFDSRAFLNVSVLTGYSVRRCTITYDDGQPKAKPAKAKRRNAKSAKARRGKA